MAVIQFVLLLDGLDCPVVFVLNLMNLSMTVKTSHSLLVIGLDASGIHFEANYAVNYTGDL